MAGFNNDVMYADNVRFDGAEFPGQVTADGQLLIGSTAAPNIRVGTLTSSGGTLTITNGPGTINLDLAGGSIGADSFQVQSAIAPGVNPVVPTGAGLVNVNGAAVAAAGVPVQSISRAANTLNIEIQRADDFGVSSAANAGIASFNNANFSVDGNGYVSFVAGAGGVNITPNTGVNVTNATYSLLGAQVAAGVNPIRTNGTAANSMQIEVQRSSAQAGSTLTANGICHFNSAQFTVDANGFVSTIAGTAPWLDTAGGALANHTGYFVTAAAAVTLPAGVANGDMVEIVDQVGGGVIVTAQGGNFIQIQNTSSTANGTATSTQKGDSLRLVFRLADLRWYCCPGAGGNWILA